MSDGRGGGAFRAGLLVLALCTVGVVADETPTSVRAGPVCQSVVIPAYFYPSAGGLWSDALAVRPAVGIMIANVDNGPGTAVNGDYVTAIAAARAAGVRVVGYVHTSYGAIAASAVQADIAGWRTLYGVTSIFLDEASTSSSELAYYETLSRYVHAHAAGAQTIVNFGTGPAESEMSAGDILVTFEGDYATYRATRFPSWTASYEPSRFYNIVYDVPDHASMVTVLREAAAAGVGQIYVTDDVIPNPYDTLPPYLSAESLQARSNC